MFGNIECAKKDEKTDGKIKQLIKYLELKVILCVAALVNTFDSDKTGFHLTVCQQFGCYVQQLESWFDARQIWLFPIVFNSFNVTGVPEASNLRLLCSQVS